MFDYANYRKQVLLKYKEKRDGNILCLRLAQPTPGKLKAECVAVCKERYHQKDQEILRTFFGPYKNEKVCLQNIEDFEIDKFRPLLNFLKESVSEPEDKNIELLAWLIDFEPRPFDHTKTYCRVESDEQSKEVTDIENNSSVIEKDTPKVSDDEVYERDKEGVTDIENNSSAIEKDTPKVSDGEFLETKELVTGSVGHINKPGFNIRRRISLIAGIVLIFIAVVMWLMLLPTGGCMYWTGDHYQPIPCTEKIDDKLIVALDTVKVKYFKRITLKDTITRNAKGSVWYSKINNEIEFYTSSGYHPIVIQHRLKPLSDHIINTYIHPGMTSK